MEISTAFGLCLRLSALERARPYLAASVPEVQEEKKKKKKFMVDLVVDTHTPEPCSICSHYRPYLCRIGVSADLATIGSQSH